MGLRANLCAFNLCVGLDMIMIVGVIVGVIVSKLVFPR